MNILDTSILTICINGVEIGFIDDWPVYIPSMSITKGKKRAWEDFSLSPRIICNLSRFLHKFVRLLILNNDFISFIAVYVTRLNITFNKMYNMNFKIGAVTN